MVVISENLFSHVLKEVSIKVLYFISNISISTPRLDYDLDHFFN